MESKSKQWLAVHNPATQELLCRVPLSTAAELHAAVASAKAAFPRWRDTPVPARTRIMFRFLELIKQHKEQLAAVITAEQGKTLADAAGDVFRGLGQY